MIVLLIALLSAFFAASGVWYLFGLLPSIFPGILVFVISYILLARRISIQIEQEMKGLYADLQKGRFQASIPKIKEMQKKYANWQFFLKSSLDGQIGTILYMLREPEKAKPYLEKAFVKHWAAKAMLGVIYYQKKDWKNMEKTFEQAARYSPKQGLLWSLWAYCHAKEGRNQEALSILSRGKNALGGADPHLEQNHALLQNQKKMKMKAYGEQWYQFLLETPPIVKQTQNRSIRFMQR